MIHILITTCVHGGNLAGGVERKNIYLHRIPQAFQIFKEIFSNMKFVIINNCGEENADYLYLLEDDSIELFHTNNNFNTTPNKGWKELKDIQDYISFYNVDDNDFIVKLTGRYLIEKTSPFLEAMKTKYNDNIDCIIRLGDYYDSNITNYKLGDEIDCLSGLVGMRSKLFKNMPLPSDYENVEWLYAKCFLQIDYDRTIVIPDIGVNIFV
jgi:hypothetical protein